MTLLHLALKQVYYHCINTCLNFISSGYWHCTCDKFQGCRKRNGERVYCYICRDLKTYGQWDFETVKDELIKLIKLALAFFEGVKSCPDFDETIDYFWMCDYEYTWRDDVTGEIRGCYLKNCD